MKKVLSVFLTICITLGLFVPPVFAAEQHTDTACYISNLTIDKDQMTAQVSFSTGTRGLSIGKVNPGYLITSG